MDSLSELPLITKFLVAFAIVFVLIIATFWLLRRFGGTRLGSNAARGRQPRLAVIDAAAVDGRRRLVLIRRDNVEHLVMIGGPADVVIEQNIVRAVPVASAREMPRAPVQSEPHLDAAPPRAEPPWQPTEPSRQQRPAPAGEDLWANLEPPARTPRAAAEAAARSEPPRSESARAERREPRPAPSDVPPVRPPAPPITAGKQGAEPAAEPRTPPLAPDVNLADMAQRLEAALRRPIPVGDRRASEPTKSAPAAEKTEKSASPAGPAAPAEGAANEPARPSGQPPRTADTKPSASKSVLDSLEAEMANLLGRPGGKE